MDYVVGQNYNCKVATLPFGGPSEALISIVFAIIMVASDYYLL